MCVFPFCVQDGGAWERAGRERLIRDVDAGLVPEGVGGWMLQKEIWLLTRMTLGK